MRLALATFTAVSLVLALPAVPAAAQAAAAIVPGMQVTDTSGARVGMVTAVKGGNILVKTDRHEALLPKASFTVSNGKLLFGMTQAQLDSELDRTAAAAAASIAPGATVKGLGGTALGTIESVAADTITVKLPSDKLVKVPRAGVRGNADGTVTIGLSADQLEAQLQPAPVAADSTAAADSTGQ